VDAGTLEDGEFALSESWAFGAGCRRSRRAFNAFLFGQSMMFLDEAPRKRRA